MKDQAGDGKVGERAAIKIATVVAKETQQSFIGSEAEKQKCGVVASGTQRSFMGSEVEKHKHEEEKGESGGSIQEQSDPGQAVEWANVNLCNGFLYLPVTADGVPIHALIDSGSMYTIVSEEIFSRFKEQSGLRDTEVKLRAAGGSSIRVKGEVIFSLKIGDEVLETRALVARIVEDLIIGSNFMLEHGASLDFQGLVLQMRGQEIPLIRARRTKKRATGIISLVDHKEVSERGILKCRVEGDQVSVPGTYWYTPTAAIDGRMGPFMVNLCQKDIEVEVESLINGVNLVFQPGDIVGNIEEVSSDFCKEKVETWNWPKEERAKEIYDQLKIEENALLTGEQKAECRKLIGEYHDVFSLSDKEIGLSDLYVHKIKLKSEEVVINKNRPIPLHSFDAAKKLITDLIDMGVLEPSNSVHRNAIVFVKKKSGGMRGCLDFRELNRLTEDNLHPMPTIMETRNIWANCKWWSVLDLSSAYYQIGKMV